VGRAGAWLIEADVGGRLDPAVAAIRRAVRDACTDLEPGAAVLVACSGGADSMALAAGAVFEGSRAGWLVGAGIVDHQLQPGSARVAIAVADRVKSLGCDPVEVVTVAVGDAGGPEGAARSARYAALEELAGRTDAIVLLGHTRDDQAESVLLGLARGSGPRSLSGMSPVRGRFRRPLLSLPRDTTRQACRALGIQVWDDPHNAETRFARARVRRSVLPVLEAELGPGVAAALARTSDLARDDTDLLDALAGELTLEAGRDGGLLEVGILAEAPIALRRRVLRQAAIEAGCPPGDLTYSHVEQIDRLVTDWHGQAGVDLPGAVRATRSTSAPSGAYLHFAAQEGSVLRE
jgi:tRNA(Ile)-lysidine synthase